MTLTKWELDCVATDLADLLAGLRVRKVFHIGRDRIALDLGRQGFLLLSGARATGRLHLAERVDKSGRCPALCGLLRKYLAGSVILDVSTWPDDRVAEVRFGRKVTLVLYVYGKGYALLDADRRVLGASHSCPVALGSVIPDSGKESGTSIGCDEEETKAKTILRNGSCRDSKGQGASGRFAGRGLDLQRQVEEAYRVIEERLLFEEARRRVSKLLKSQKKKLLRLQSRMEEDLGRRARAEEKQRYADLLLANKTPSVRGADHVVVKDWFQEGSDFRVPLDPRYSIAQNAERYYRQAKRDRRAAALAHERLQDVDARLSLVESFLGAMDGADSLSEISAIEVNVKETLGLGGGVQASGQSAKSPPDGRRQKGDEEPGRRFVSATGLEIRVGGDAQENHRLTFHWARGRDMWFHVAGRSGPHVVVRVGPEGAMDSETLLDAATLALFYVAKNRRAEGEVLYQRRKYLRPIKKSPGLVRTAGAKTIFLRLDTQRLSRLLSQRG